MRFKARLKVTAGSVTYVDWTQRGVCELPEISIYNPEQYLATNPASPTNIFRSTDTKEPASVAYSLLYQAAHATGTYGYNSYNVGAKIKGALERSSMPSGYHSWIGTLYMSTLDNASRFIFGSNITLRYYNPNTPYGSSDLNNSLFTMDSVDLRTFGYFYVFILPSTNPNATHHWVVWNYLYNGVDYFYTYCCYRSNHDTLSPAWWEGFNETFAGAQIPSGTPYPDLPPSEGGDEIADGTLDWSSDEVPDPPSLTEDATDTGFTRIYNPTLAQLQDFARYMWTDTNIFSTVWSVIARYFEDPMEAFISLSILPIAIPNTTNPVAVKMLFLPTGKYMYAATQQFITVDLGSVNLNEFWGSALDYAPNTKIDLFLPYIGTVPVDPDEVMGKEVKVTYKVDICTGCCVAIVSVKLTKSDSTLTWVPLYQLSGNCAVQIPFTSSNMDRYIDAALKAATIALTAGAGAAAGAATAAASAAPTMAESTTAAAAVESHQMNFTKPTTTGAVFQAQQEATSKAAKYNHIATATRGLSAGLGVVSGAKPQFQHSSPFTANSGYMSYRVPFFIIKSPRLVNPDQYGKYNGYPSLTYQQFSVLDGYTEVQQVQLTNINATANELDEIQSLLKTGVIM